MDACFVQRCFDGMKQDLAGIAAFIRIGNMFKRLGAADLFGQMFQRGLHQRIHRCDGFAEGRKTYRGDLVGVYGNSDAGFLGAESQRSGIYAGYVECLTGGGGRSFFWTEHNEQKYDQKNAETDKNSSIQNLFHSKDNDLCFRTHGNLRGCLL